MKHYKSLHEAVGKVITSDGKKNTYIHRSAVDTLPADVQDRIESGSLQIPKSFYWNFLAVNPDYVSYVNAEDFDKVFEPVLGERYKVSADGSVKFIPRPNKPLILHQRYKTVKPNYKGFDIEADKEREVWYRKHFSGGDMARAGYLHNWEKMLQTIKETASNIIRLYRGLTQPLDLKYDIEKSDAPQGYTTWTDSLELAKQYAGDDTNKGYVYYIDLPKSEMGDSPVDENPKSDTYGDRFLFYFNNKPAGIKGVKGKEFLVYTHHDLYDPKKIKQYK